jgi:signal transduction histidine kinase
MGIRRSDMNPLSKGWRVVDRNLDRIFKLTLNLLAYSRPRTPNLEMVNPKKVIDECLELIAPMADEKGVMAVSESRKISPPFRSTPTAAPGADESAQQCDGRRPAKEGLIRIGCRYDAKPT